MENFKNLDIEQLLAERPFELLTEAEKSAVLAQMPDWEYDRLHQLLLRSRAALKQGPKLNPAIRENLLAALRKQEKPKQETLRPTGLLVRLVQYRMPVWQAAAGLALLLVAHFTLKKPAPVAAMQTETVYVNTTDTIYKEIAVPVADTSAKLSKKRVNVKPRLAAQPQTTAANSVAIADTDYGYDGRFAGLPDTLPGFQLNVEQPNGRSANEMKELWQFVGQVY